MSVRATCYGELGKKVVGGQEGYFVVFFFYYYFARRTARSRGEKGAGLSGTAVFH